MQVCGVLGFLCPLALRNNVHERHPPPPQGIAEGSREHGAGLGDGETNPPRRWEEGSGRWVSPNFLGENMKHPTSECPVNVC